MSDIKVVTLVSGEHRWICLYDDAHRSEVLRRLGLLLLNPDSGLSVHDALAVALEIAKEAAKHEHP